MKKYFTADYLSYILFRLLGFFIRRVSKRTSLFLGKRLGDFFYYFDYRHKAVAYSNIKTALGDTLTPPQLNRLTREFYQTLGQNLVEIFFIPLVNKEYMHKYVTIEGLENIWSAFKRGKGVIFLGVHEGSWELSNIISANLGFPFSMLVRDQGKYPRVQTLLNLYRSQQGCKLINRHDQTRQLIEVLKKNEAIGMTADQGGKAGRIVKFFGRDASMSTGAVRLSLKYGAAILPAFYERLNGPYVKLIIEQPFEIKKGAESRQKDIRDNLQALVSIFERYIRKCPKEYLWSYKIWKHGGQRNILILSDNKTGHLRQAQAAAGIVKDYLKTKEISADIKTVELSFKNKFAKPLFSLFSCLSGRYSCQGCLACLKSSLDQQVYNSLIKNKADIVISCGSSSAAVNFLISRENFAKSIAVLRPGLLSTKKFDLVIMPKHDNPPKRINIVETNGALNLIDEEYLKGESKKLIESALPNHQPQNTYIGLLIGGDTKGFSLNKEIILELIRQIKAASEKLNTGILATTSRRTPAEVADLLKEELKNYPRCKLLVIANDKNIPSGVGGILGLSKVIITSPESISMISEAVNSSRPVLVVKMAGLNRRHKKFLESLGKDKYIHLVEKAGDLSAKIEDIFKDKPQVKAFGDRVLIREALGRIL